MKSKTNWLVNLCILTLIVCSVILTYNLYNMSKLVPKENCWNEKLEINNLTDLKYKGVIDYCSTTYYSNRTDSYCIMNIEKCAYFLNETRLSEPVIKTDKLVVMDYDTRYLYLTGNLHFWTVNLSTW